MITLLKTIIVIFVLLFSLPVFAKQKVIYGKDNRRDIYQETNPEFLDWAFATAAMISSSRLIKIKDKNFIVGSTLEQQGICSDQKFAEQIAAAKCSGFLVAEDTIVTAGHCVKDMFDCSSNRWVFGFNYSDSQTTLRVNVSDDEIYECSQIISRDFDKTTKMDYAIVKLDRKVLDRTPLKLRSEGKVSDDANLMIIGHPSGLATKISDSAVIRSNEHPAFFKTDLDSFHGNSGSAVIDVNSGLVEGILVRGDQDFTFNWIKNCREVNVCKKDECRGEDVLRINLLPLDLI